MCMCMCIGKKHSIYKGQSYLRFQAVTGGLGMGVTTGLGNREIIGILSLNS